MLAERLNKLDNELAEEYLRAKKEWEDKWKADFWKIWAELENERKRRTRSWKSLTDMEKERMAIEHIRKRSYWLHLTIVELIEDEEYLANKKWTIEAEADWYK